jgi:hypothetical protein
MVMSVNITLMAHLHQITDNYAGGNNPGRDPFSPNDVEHVWKDWLPTKIYGEQVTPGETTYE